MRKRYAAILALAAALALILSIPALAVGNEAVEYYDQNGNRITVAGMYYNSQGYPMYNASCYYLDTNGDPVYVGGCRAYYYNAEGKLTAGNYYYDTSCNAVARPVSYPGGWGCGRYYYSDQGDVVSGTFYYDDFGNPVDPPAANQTPAYRGGGCCSRWR